MRRFVRIYGRTLAFLAPYKATALVLCGANLALAAVGNLALAAVGFLEPVLFGRVIQSLSGDGHTGGTIVLWAGLGVLGIGAGMATSLIADRLAHRLKVRVMGQAYGHLLQLPAAYHARHPTGTVTRTLWAGTDEMFGLW